MAIAGFAPKKTLITGAASGIGRATALAVAREGAQLVLTDVDKARLEDAVEDIRSHGGSVLMAEAFDIASISTWGRIQDLEHHHWRRTVEIDLMGPIHILESFVPPMIDAGRGGHIVNVSSAAGLFDLPLHAPYSAAKFGLRGVSEVLRFNLERHNIGVTLVCPGAVDTPLVGTVDIVGVDRDDPKVQRAIADFQRHSVTPDQAAQAILKGVKRGKYLVFTSRDIRVGHWAQRYFPFGYRFAMRRLNRRVQELVDRQ
ncbi:MAG: SDR family oxidoreductase [Actinomycetota bacterium]|nr:SDR family oxidoreductase [Actinomycetota bacterium]